MINTINEVKSLQYDCYLQLGLLMLMMTSSVVRFYFHDVLGDYFEIRDKPYGGSLNPTLTVGPNIRLVNLYSISRRLYMYTHGIANDIYNIIYLKNIPSPYCNAWSAAKGGGPVFI